MVEHHLGSLSMPTKQSYLLLGQRKATLSLYDVLNCPLKYEMELA